MFFFENLRRFHFFHNLEVFSCKTWITNAEVRITLMKSVCQQNHWLLGPLQQVSSNDLTYGHESTVYRILISIINTL